MTMFPASGNWFINKVIIMDYKIKITTVLVIAYALFVLYIFFNQMALQKPKSEGRKNIITADIHEPSIKTGT